jgi:hypothetical protein
MGGLFPSFWLALSSSLQVVGRELIAGGAVGFHFFTLLLPGNDDIAGIPASVDDGVKVARGGVVKVPCWFVWTARCLRWARFAFMSLRRSF